MSHSLADHCGRLHSNIRSYHYRTRHANAETTSKGTHATEDL